MPSTNDALENGQEGFLVSIDGVRIDIVHGAAVGATMDAVATQTLAVVEAILGNPGDLA